MTMPPWFDALLLNDPKACEKVVLREVRLLWRALHPDRKKPGPRSLPDREVWTATDKVLKALTPRQWTALEWKELIAKVQDRIGTKPRGELYSAATIRTRVRQHIYMHLRVDEIPPRLLDRRQFRIPPGAKTLDDLDLALHEFKSGLPFADAGYTRFKDYYIPSSEFEASYRARTKKRSK